MKKIMFNDRYGLTKAVIEGRKTVTRRHLGKIDYPINRVQGRVCPGKNGEIYAVVAGESIIIMPKYKVGEVVAVAQPYRVLYDKDIVIESNEGIVRMKDCAGWANKMFVRGDLMPHRIRITDISCERLQDITDGECMREGVIDVTYFKIGDKPYELYAVPTCEDEETFNTPKQAFAALIDKVSSRGTWARNPWVIVYEFELVK